MTTTIASKQPTALDPVSLSITGGTGVHFSINTPLRTMQIYVEPTALLDAVRSELGVLVVDKADLPEVVQDDVGDVYVNGLLCSHDVQAHREAARHHLALAAHLEAHPPVDEQQVEALAGLLEEAAGWDTNQQRDAAARALIATGKVTVQS